MSGISAAAHNKFISRFRSSIVENIKEDPDEVPDEEMRLLKSDIDELQKIIDEYRITFSKLQRLVQQYRLLLHRTRVNMRRHQLKLIKAGTKKSES